MLLSVAEVGIDPEAVLPFRYIDTNLDDLEGLTVGCIVEAERFVREDEGSLVFVNETGCPSGTDSSGSPDDDPVP